jgi:ketosteroid isomerase-like protein
MRLGTIHALAICTVLVSTTCAGPALAQSKTLKQTFEAANQKLNDYLSSGDAAGAASLYATKAKLLPPNAPEVSGREAIQKFWQSTIEAGVRGLKITTVEAEGQISGGTEVSTWEALDKDGKVLDRGKAIVIWKVEQGQWRLYRDIWNSDGPAAASSSAPAPAPATGGASK